MPISFLLQTCMEEDPILFCPTYSEENGKEGKKKSSRILEDRFSLIFLCSLFGYSSRKKYLHWGSNHNMSVKYGNVV